MKLIDPVDIGGRLVSPGHPAYLIAEAGVNHNGELELALLWTKCSAWPTFPGATRLRGFYAPGPPRSARHPGDERPLLARGRDQRWN